jgi:hypothetical protein
MMVWAYTRMYVRMGDKRYSIMAWQVRTHGKCPKGRHQQTWEEDLEEKRK